MRLNRRLCFSLLVLTVSSSVSMIAAATVVTQSYNGVLPTTISGTLANQGTALEETFTLPTSTSLTIFTTSYASGGFQPNITLFSAAGNYVAGPVVPGASPVAAVDPSTNMALDAYLTASSIPAGTYILALTDFELNQSPTATNLSDGFTANYGDGIHFVDEGGNMRNGSYALTLQAAGTPVSSTPEPASIWLVAPFVVGIGFLAAKKRRVSESK